MNITLVNESKRITDPQDLREIAAAINRQLGLHVAPAYRRLTLPVLCTADPTKVAAGAMSIVIVDNPTQAGALGYHTEDPANTPGGMPVVHGFSFVDPVLDNGGTILDGENSVAAVTSHEVLEAWCDPNCQLWADNQQGVAYAYEVCDPCETDAYTIHGVTRPVSVSNFILPAWFDELTPKGVPVDYMHKLAGPFTLDAGGYFSYLSEGQPQQQFGQRMEQWKIDAHRLPGTRMARRTLRHLATA